MNAFKICAELLEKVGQGNKKARHRWRACYQAK
jgi:hypothetical protein